MLLCYFRLETAERKRIEEFKQKSTHLYSTSILTHTDVSFSFAYFGLVNSRLILLKRKKVVFNGVITDSSVRKSLSHC